MSKLDRLLSLKTRFYNAENPSPVKLSAAFAQIEAAFDTLEYIVGNGTDTFTTIDNPRSITEEGRLLVPNLSSAIGQGSRIYKPINLFKDLKDAYGAITVIGTNTKSLSNLEDNISINGTFTITFAPVPYQRYISIYNSADTHIIYNGIEYNQKWSTFIVTSGTSSFTANAPNGIIVKEIAIYEAVDYIAMPAKDSSRVETCNIAVSMPLQNPNFWAVKTPCKNAGKCPSKNTEYCIGNTYDNSGAPACIGATPYTYTPDTASNKKIIQSSLLKVRVNPNQIFNAPFGFNISNKIEKDTELPNGTVCIYDTSLSTGPSLFNIPIFRADNKRRDMFYTTGDTAIAELSDNTNRFILIGGNYGLADQIFDQSKLKNVETDVIYGKTLVSSTIIDPTITNLTLDSSLINTSTINDPNIFAAKGILVLPSDISPKQTEKGSVKWDKDNDLLTIGTGTTRKIMADTISTQTLLNKTLITPVLTNPVINNQNGTLIIPQSSSPDQVYDGSLKWDTANKWLTIGNGSNRNILIDENTQQNIAHKTIIDCSIAESSFDNISINGTLDASNANASFKNVEFDATWETPLKINSAFLWADESGNLRIDTSKPLSSAAGVQLGVGGGSGGSLSLGSITTPLIANKAVTSEKLSITDLSASYTKGGVTSSITNKQSLGIDIMASDQYGYSLLEVVKKGIYLAHSEWGGINIDTGGIFVRPSAGRWTNFAGNVGIEKLNIGIGTAANAPETVTSQGYEGDIRICPTTVGLYTEYFLYACVAPNSWRRVQLSTW